VGLGRYLKAAFANRWNLLAVGAATVFAFLTGRPDVVLPVVAAGELAYLGLLGTHPRFQRAVDAQAAKASRDAGAARSTEVLRRITRSLPRELFMRYEGLKERAAELRQIAIDLRPHADAAEEGSPFEDLQLRSLDRLLWIFLRLLYTQWSISRFLDRTSEAHIRRDIARLEEQLAEHPADDASPHRAKVRQTIRDNLETSRTRLVNLAKARENHELVGLEIERLDNKIRSLAELAVNRQEPDFITAQVDAVAAGMVETERTMNELRFATGLAETDDAVPELVTRPQTKETA
jgi:hypothetical protein